MYPFKDSINRDLALAQIAMPKAAVKTPDLKWQGNKTEREHANTGRSNGNSPPPLCNEVGLQE